MADPLPRMLRPLSADQRETLERRWRSHSLAPKPQKPCDHGLFSNDAAQLDFVEMFAKPTNEE